MLLFNIYNTGFLFLIVPKRIEKCYYLFYSLSGLFRGTWKITKSVHLTFIRENIVCDTLGEPTSRQVRQDFMET